MAFYNDEVFQGDDDEDLKDKAPYNSIMRDSQEALPTKDDNPILDANTKRSQDVANRVKSSMDPILRMMQQNANKVDSKNNETVSQLGAANLGQALGSFANIANGPQNLSPIYQGIEKQKELQNKLNTESGDRKDKVFQKIAEKYGDAEKFSIQNETAKQKMDQQKITNDLLRSGQKDNRDFNQSYKTEKFDQQTNIDAVNAGKEFTHDPLLQQTTKNLANIKKAEGILYGDKPVTAKTFNTIQQDLINALAQGNATEGKVNREMVETLVGKLNDLKQRFGSVEDLRKDQPEVVQNIADLINQVKDDFLSIQEGRAKEVHSNFKHSTNDKARLTADDKLNYYTDRSEWDAKSKQNEKKAKEIWGDKASGAIPDANAAGKTAMPSKQDMDALQHIKDFPNDPDNDAMKAILRKKRLINAI